MCLSKGRCLLPKPALSILSLETDLIGFHLERRDRAGLCTFFFSINPDEILSIAPFSYRHE